MDPGQPYSLATLSMAAEQAAMQDSYVPSSMHMSNDPNNVHLGPHDGTSKQPDLMQQFSGENFEESLDSLANFMDNGLTTNGITSGGLSSYFFAGQPMPFFSPSDSMTWTHDPMQQQTAPSLPNFNQVQSQLDEPASFSRFGSRLPSLQPEEKSAHSFQRPLRARGLSDISVQERDNMAQKISHFSSALSPNFQLPSRLALSRYVAAYVNGFHEHLPFLHIPSISVDHCSVELILAMAAVGAQYCFEGEKGIELFNASQAIAAQRIRRRDARLIAINQGSENEDFGAGREPVQMSSMGGANDMQSPDQQPRFGPLGLPSDSIDLPFMEKEDLVQTAQALLLLMAMATWAKHKEILREALAIQSVLATLVRDDGLRTMPPEGEPTWEEWIRYETTKRTKLIIYCFFNLHSIVYNIPPLILNPEVKLKLPCSAREFRADTAARWQEARSRALPETGFQEGLERLFSRSGRDVTEQNASLGNYILIHALIQHIFFIRQSARYRMNGDSDLMSEDVQSLEQALRNWQMGWSRNPESSLDPMDPNGPVAFNSTALLRLAYIRLNVDTGPGRALDTRDPFQIANAFRESPAIKRTPKLVRAVLHSAHALSIPIKIGIRLVAATQTFIWSIQHSLCSLECAFLLSKWLEALSHPDPPISDDERRIGSIVRTMLDETEFAVPSHDAIDSPESFKHMSAGVLRVWATIFRGAQTWAIVDVIGTSLNIYADTLEAG